MNDFITILVVTLCIMFLGFLIYRWKRKNDVAFNYLANGLSACGLVRQKNEDSFLVANQQSLILCAVADGMGGKERGDLASLTSIEVLRQEVSSTKDAADWGKWLLKATQRANWEVIKKAQKLKGKGTIGSTLVSTVITGNKAYFANVGDSRAYLLRNNNFWQITKDHSLVSLLVEKQLIKPEEVYNHPRRGEIMRFVGQGEEIDVDLFTVDLMPEDIILLCSDGLWEMVRDFEISAIITNSPDPADACQKLIDAANRAGGTDNITAVVISIRQGN